MRLGGLLNRVKSPNQVWGSRHCRAQELSLLEGSVGARRWEEGRILVPTRPQDGAGRLEQECL